MKEKFVENVRCDFGGARRSDLVFDLSVPL
jgi:hypothetical protein